MIGNRMALGPPVTNIGLIKMINQAHCFLWGIITHLCPNFKDSL